MPLQRLDRLLGDSGFYSRSQARSVIAAGRVSVDGMVITRADAKVSRDSRILAEGRELDCAEFVYYMLHKPANYVSATEDERWPAVTKLFPPELRRRGIFSVGRLDADVTGLLLMTDDGAFAHRITSPRSETEKCYLARVDRPLSAEDAAAMAAGTVMPDGTEYRPARLQIDENDPCLACVTVTEGKFHEVKNLFAVRGKTVLELKRLSIGRLKLDESLAPGQWRKLTPEELAQAEKKRTYGI